MNEPLGPRSATVHELRRLFSSRRRRREEGRFVVEGAELVRAALDAGWPIERAVIDEGALGDRAFGPLLGELRRSGVEPHTLRAGVLGRIADAASAQPIAASIVGRPRSLGDLTGAEHFVLVADRVQDPGNLGALTRVAEACGADAVVVTGDSADPFGPKAMRGSTGSALRVPIVEERDALAALGALRGSGLSVASTSPHGGGDFAHLRWPSRVALLLGNEAGGLSDELLDAGDLCVRIPMAPGVESLNLSVSAGILAMAIYRGLVAPEPGSAGSTIVAMPSPEPS